MLRFADKNKKIRNIDGLTVLSVEEEIDRYDCDCFELDDIIPCEEGN